MARTPHINIEDYQMKVIKLIDDFAIWPVLNLTYPLRHFCQPIPKDFWPHGWPLNRVEIEQGICNSCKEQIPPKVIFMYKLWCFQNNR